MQAILCIVLDILVGHHVCLPVGNATAVASLISASVTLDVTQQDVVTAVLAGNNDTLALLQNGTADDTTNATAANIAGAIGSANLPSQVAAQALKSAIAQSVTDLLQADPGIVIQAAILSNNSQAVMPAFVMVSTSCSTSLHTTFAMWYHRCFDTMRLHCSSNGHKCASSLKRQSSGYMVTSCISYKTHVLLSFGYSIKHQSCLMSQA